MMSGPKKAQPELLAPSTPNSVLQGLLKAAVFSCCPLLAIWSTATETKQALSCGLLV